ncbi:unnamed protein product [Cylicocyclus nassatus]|uniref:Uncharacterized protein n=1 Tax=Cylicocyclus nassatus TaxID=53992 RepID=A0AA36H6J6_CYLNA|nr:unnamed protein product [Cylicocyclus nassatus]
MGNFHVIFIVADECSTSFGRSKGWCTTLTQPDTVFVTCGDSRDRDETFNKKTSGFFRLKL